MDTIKKAEDIIVQVDFYTYVNAQRKQLELLHAIYNAFLTASFRNVAFERYEGKCWSVKCEGTNIIINNEIGGIIRESDGEIIANTESESTLLFAYAVELMERGGTAEKIYVSK